MYEGTSFRRPKPPVIFLSPPETPTSARGARAIRMHATSLFILTRHVYLHILFTPCFSPHLSLLLVCKIRPNNQRTLRKGPDLRPRRPSWDAVVRSPIIRTADSLARSDCRRSRPPRTACTSPQRDAAPKSPPGRFRPRNNCVYSFIYRATSRRTCRKSSCAPRPSPPAPSTPPAPPRPSTCTFPTSTNSLSAASRERVARSMLAR